MKKLVSTVFALLLIQSVARAQFCPSCIQNSAVPQNAQMNIGTATVRGTLTVGNFSSSSLNASTITAGNFVGSGTFITNLNASQLGYGTVPSGVVSGNYPNITGVGTLTSATYNGTIIKSQYGGTGANLVTSSSGSIPYFSSVGTMSALAPSVAGYLLQTNGSSAPSWTGVPQIVGTNITAIPMANLLPGQLPTTISVNDASISTVSASKVIGNIPGYSTNITGILPLSHLSSGTLTTSNAASSVTASGVTPGIWGGPYELPQITVAYDGRITAISQSTFSVSFSSSMTGPLPIGITVQPSQISSGSLSGAVIASSIAATSVVPGSYGNAAKSARITVGQDGRLSFANEQPIAILPAQIATGTLPSYVSVPASNILSGALGTSVIASSLTATGVSAGVYGSSTTSVKFVIRADGRISSAQALPIPGVSSFTATTNSSNTWTSLQTFLSSITVTNSVTAGLFIGDGSQIGSIMPSNLAPGTLPSNVVASSVSIPYLVVPSSVTASAFVGSGANLTNLNPSNVSAGTLPSNVVASSVSIPFLVTPGSVTASAFVGSGANLTSLTASNISAGTLPSNVVASSVSLIYLTVPSSVTASVFIGDGSHLTGIPSISSNVVVPGAGAQSAVAYPSPSISGNAATGNYSSVLGGQTNNSIGDFSFIGGGVNNITTGADSVIAGGLGNQTFTIYGTIGGGAGNSATGSGSTISGGNNNTTNANDETIAGGDSNTTNGLASSISGGEINLATGDHATIGGGDHNSATGTNASVSGGGSNTASGRYTSIPGGAGNIASGDYSFAAGRRANASTEGSMVLSDSETTYYSDHGMNTFNLRFVNGVFVDSGNFTAQYGVTAGTFTGNGAAITALTAANISAGSLGVSVIASSVAASGVLAGTYGSSSLVPQIIVGIDGRISSASNVSITGVPASSVPAAGVLAGSLNSSVIASSIAVNSINSSSQIVVGTILGSRLANNTLTNSQILTGTFSNISIPATNVNAGSLGASVIASSVAASGISAATYGSATQTPQIAFGIDGRATSASNVTITPAAGSITSGTLGASVIASSVAATSVVPGSYGSTTQVGTFTVGIDGRLTAASNATISGVPAATVPASGVQSGTLGASVIASSIASNGVISGTYGTATQVSQVTISSDGRVTSATNVAITGAPPTGAAGGSLSGSYPNPSLGSQVVVSTNIATGTIADSNVTLTTGAISSGKFGDNRIAITTGALSGIVAIASGGTSSNTASGARSALSAAQSGANADITSLSMLNTITNNVTNTSTLTIQGNAFSVGVSSFVVSQGKVGIGTTTLSSDLTVIQSSNLNPAISVQYYGNDAVGPAVIGRKARGTSSSPTAAQSDDRLSTFGGAAYDGSSFPSSSTAHIQMLAKNNQTTSDHSSYIVFNTVSSGTIVISERMRITDTGSVGISTTAPVSTFTVVGTITGTSSMTAANFIGNGYSLTGITISSATKIANATFTNSAFGICFATITITTRGLPVRVSVSATGQDTLGGATLYSGSYLVDGSFPSDSGSEAILSTQYANANHDFPVMFDVVNSGVSSGSHSFCLTLATSGGTGTILNDSTHYTQFLIQERP